MEEKEEKGMQLKKGTKEENAPTFSKFPPGDVASFLLLIFLEQPSVLEKSKQIDRKREKQKKQ